jgi:hypothetical protein
MGFYNPANEYLDALRVWRASDMPTSAMANLDRLWNKLTSTEKAMVAKLIAVGLRHEREHKSDQDARPRGDDLN